MTAAWLRALIPRVNLNLESSQVVIQPSVVTEAFNSLRFCPAPTEQPEVRQPQIGGMAAKKRYFFIAVAMMTIYVIVSTLGTSYPCLRELRRPAEVELRPIVPLITAIVGPIRPAFRLYFVVVMVRAVHNDIRTIDYLNEMRANHIAVNYQFCVNTRLVAATSYGWDKIKK